MTLGKQTICIGGMALALVVTAGQTNGQNAAPFGTQSSQQNVPNAPQPQTLPDLNSITPVAPAVREPAAASTSAAETPDEAVTENGGVAPGSTLPGTQATTAQAQDVDQGPPPETSRSAIDRLQVNVQFHEIPFTVKDSKGRLVPGLTYRDVRVYENGLRQRMATFSTDAAPLSVALVIDQSVTHDTMEKINASLSALQGAFSPYDEVSVFTYNNGVRKQTDFTAAQSARLGVILERSKGEGRDPLMGMTGPLSHGSVINNMPVDGVPDPGHSAGSMTLTVPREFHTLNDAILAAAQEASSTDRHRRRVVYVISDGKEYGSKASQKEVIKYLLTNNVAVWATLVGDSAIKGIGFMDRIHLPLTMRDDVLPKYTAATGGQTDPEFRPTGIEQSFARITDEVRAQYTVGYYTHESPLNESYRRTEVRVLRPGLTIVAKDGYYPNARENARRPPPVTPSATP